MPYQQAHPGATVEGSIRGILEPAPGTAVLGHQLEERVVYELRPVRGRPFSPECLAFYDPEFVPRPDIPCEKAKARNQFVVRRRDGEVDEVGAVDDLSSTSESEFLPKSRLSARGAENMLTLFSDELAIQGHIAEA